LELDLDRLQALGVGCKLVPHQLPLGVHELVVDLQDVASEVIVQAARIIQRELQFQGHGRDPSCTSLSASKSRSHALPYEVWACEAPASRYPGGGVTMKIYQSDALAGWRRPARPLDRRRTRGGAPRA